MGRRRVRNLRHLGLRALAGVEPAPQRREEVARALEIPTFATFEEGLAWEPDALVISTPPDRHVEYALDAARRGIPFFTEASVVSDGIEELVEAAARSGSLAAPSCTMRFHPAVQLMRRRLAEGTIGRPLLLTHHVGQYLPDWHPWEDYRAFYVARRETGAVREIIPYELNWLTYLFGPVVQLNCFRDKLSRLDADIDDLYAALLRFENDVHGSLVVEVISRPAVRRARIAGEEGTFEWDWSAGCVREWRASDGHWIEHPDPPPIPGPGGEWVAENMYIEEMRAYLAALERGQDAWPLSPRADLELLGTLEQLERASDEQRRAVAPRA
jgi:predicted dehydrogenase